MPHPPDYTDIPIPEYFSGPIQLRAKVLIEFDADDPQQVAAAKRLAAIHQAAREMYALLKGLEWSIKFFITSGSCPSCDYGKSNGHRDDCRLAAVLKSVEGEPNA